jgi:SpoVK/Ycf46/Vps4 family AAA+-type ATPase
LWRRFDEVIFFERPGRAEAIRLLDLKFKNFKREFVSEDVASYFDGFSHADIERICLNAIRYAVLAGQRVVRKRVFLRSIALESRRKAAAQLHLK